MRITSWTRRWRLPMQRPRTNPAAIAAALCLLAGVAVPAAQAAAPPPSWTSAGQSPSDNRFQTSEYKISALNAWTLKPKWKFITHGDVTATPTVSNGVVYFPDAAGWLYALNATTGALIWESQISSYDGVTGSYSRTSPAIYGNELILGDIVSGLHSSGAQVFAVNQSDGSLLWDTQVESHPESHITASPVVANGIAVVGVSSGEESAATSASYPCCTFRGSVVALNPSTGTILWKTYMSPANSGPCTTSDPPSGCGYSGNAVWANPAVNTATNTVFVGTGNNYTAPDTAVACQEQALQNNTSDADCTDPTDYFDAVVALNLLTGQVLWDQKVEGWDAFTVACAAVPPGTTWCPSPSSPDFDFGSGPNLFTIKTANGREPVVGVGQKSGIYWTFDQTTGAPVWNTLVGPPGAFGGIMWGTATNGTNIFVPEANMAQTSWTPLNGQPTTGGAWSEVNATTGQIEWQTATPLAKSSLGPISLAGGVVYAGSSAATGANMFALNATNGHILWRFASGGSTVSSPAIVNGNVYWGSGYSEFALLGYSGNDVFYDFTPGGK